MDDTVDTLLDPDVLADRAAGVGVEAAGLAVLGRLAAAEARLFAAVAEQLQACAVLSRRLEGVDGPERFLVLDVAGTLRTGQLAASARLAEAERLVADLPLLLAGLRRAQVLVPQARVVLEETRSCAPAVVGEVERRLLASGIGSWTARRLRTRTKALVLQVEAELDPAATGRRGAAARAGRRVGVRPEPDGMASLWALLPAEQARAFTVGLDELTRRQALADRAAGIGRTADQRRADVLATLPALALHALDGTAAPVAADGACSHPRVVVEVSVPVATALGLSHAPGDLVGYGPISAEHVRLLLPDAELRRVLVDATTGEPLPTPTGRATSRPHPGAGGIAGAGGSVRERLLRLIPDGPVVLEPTVEPGYTPSRSLARHVRTRDPLCNGPGCATASRSCDLDHAIPWPAGPTCAGNLRPLSRRCHRAKTLSWRTERHPDGTTVWTSPTGRTYPVPPLWRPPPRPQPPQHAAPTPQPHPDTWDTAAWDTAAWDAALLAHPPATPAARPAADAPAPF